jgi:hypothetical protein
MATVPRIGSEIPSTPRKILLSQNGKMVLPGGKILDGAESRDPLNTGYLTTLRAGMLLGKITASGKYAPTIIGLTTADTSTGSTDLTVIESAGDELERRVGASGNLRLIGAPTDTGVVAISASLGYDSIAAASGGNRVITLSANAPAVYVDGSFLCAADGTHLPMGIFGKETGIKVTDDDGNNLDIELHQLLIGGIVIAGNIINYPAAALTTLRQWVKNALNSRTSLAVGVISLNQGGTFKFDDDY